ncbi:hypothetical protein CK203_111747 [Vitis vinifera]|uniref:Retrotransposon gag domain-containing protein n=1 Tax=Vitis vinifera TaxID=29760 RepID=A0A438DNW8_VITVI|nr:hypothetical protein CK203_111747 [Vitis vinifera]
MRARLGPQEPGRPRPPIATTGQRAPTLWSSPWCRTCFHTVTPCHPRGAERSLAPSGTIRWEKPPKRATNWFHQQKAGRHALHAFLLSNHSLRAPKGIPRTKIFHIRWVQRPLRPYHALSTAYNARYWQRRTAVQRTCPKLSWDNTCAPPDTSRTLALWQNIKMQDNEFLREFVKRFGQAVLQVEACSMDAVLQIFKRSICPSTPFSNR